VNPDEPMTTPQPLRKFSGLAFVAVWLVGLAACSSKDDGKNAGTGGTSGSGNTAGSSSAGTAAAGKGNAGSGTGTFPDQIVGTFQIQALEDEKDDTTGITKVVGAVGDGPIPSNVVWTVAKSEGDCKLETPMAPFCADGCGSDVCVADDKCQAYPTSHSVGDVVLSGVNLSGGGAMLTLKEIAKNYQPPAGTTFAYPPFAAGDEIKLQAGGGDYSAFDLSTKGVDPLHVTSTDFELDTGKPFELTWDAAKDPKASQVYIKLDISHHGGIRGMIECTTDDTGSLTLSGDMMSELIGLGVAGYPSVVLMRQSIDTTQIEPGLVRLEVSSRAERYVTIKGVESCTTDEDCPNGKTCRTTDSTCQ
jgi:hypothetical protein